MPTTIRRGEPLPARPAGGLYALEPDAAGQLDREQVKAALGRGFRLACGCGREMHLGRAAKQGRTGLRWYVNCWRYRDGAFARHGVLEGACRYYACVTMPAGWAYRAAGEEDRLARLEARVERLERRLRRFTGPTGGAAAPAPP